MTHVISESRIVSRRERRDAVENRMRILTIARQLFVEQGVDATSMNEIAQVAQVGPGTLYRHFAHKGELCEVLLTEDITAFWGRVDAAFAQSTDSALDQLRWLIDEFIRMIDSHVPLFTAIPLLKPGSHYQSPFYRRSHELISSLLATALAQGEIVEINVEFTADAILAAIAPPLFVFQRECYKLSVEQITTTMHHLFVDGLRVRLI